MSDLEPELVLYDYEKHCVSAKYLTKSLYHVFVYLLNERNVLPKNHFDAKEKDGLGLYFGLRYKFEINRVLMKTFKSLKYPLKNKYLKSFSLLLGAEGDPSEIFEEFKFTISYGLIENLVALEVSDIKHEVRKMMWLTRMMCSRLKKLPKGLTVSFQAEYTTDAPKDYQLPGFSTCYRIPPGKIVDSVRLSINGGYYKGEISVWSQYEKERKTRMTI